MTEETFEEQEEEWSEPRSDFTFFCALAMRTTLVVDGVCFSRLHGQACSQCRYDNGPAERVLARLILVLCDMIKVAEWVSSP